jgi:hypothetical protein
MIEEKIQQELICELILYLEKTCVKNIFLPHTEVLEEEHYLEGVLTQIKIMNARYDKKEAVLQIIRIMKQYNVSLSEIDSVN